MLPICARCHLPPLFGRMFAVSRSCLSTDPGFVCLCLSFLSLGALAWLFVCPSACLGYTQQLPKEITSGIKKIAGTVWYARSNRMLSVCVWCLWFVILFRKICDKFACAFDRFRLLCQYVAWFVRKTDHFRIIQAYVKKKKKKKKPSEFRPIGKHS